MIVTNIKTTVEKAPSSSFNVSISSEVQKRTNRQQTHAVSCQTRNYLAAVSLAAVPIHLKHRRHDNQSTDLHTSPNCPRFHFQFVHKLFKTNLMLECNSGANSTADHHFKMATVEQLIQI